MCTCTCSICSSTWPYHILHHEGAHIYMHDTKITDGVEARGRDTKHINCSSIASFDSEIQRVFIRHC